MDLLTLTGWIVFGLFTLIVSIFFITSIVEQERRAAVVTLAVYIPFVAIFPAVFWMDGLVHQWILLSVMLVLTALAVIAVCIKTKTPTIRIVGEQTRIDERDAVFHRFYRLQPGAPELEEYYGTHPDKKDFDDSVRKLPQIDEPGSKSYYPLTTAFEKAAADIFFGISRDLEWVPNPIGGLPVEASGKELADRIKGFAAYLGASQVGCTALNPAYVYSHIGRSPGKWGAPIELNHKRAIAIAVPMSHELTRHAPAAPTTTETMIQYLEVGKIAMVVAKYINLLGYEARAHVDANYRVMCVPIAADAGLGELGRLGLLISPKHGPRIRLAVVTTNMNLAYDRPLTFGVQDFCSFCKKCADNCPSGSIDKGDKAVYAGVEKWQTNRDHCYRYWRMVGSDCGLCIKVCPYSHASNPVHDAMRWLTARNHFIRRAALFGDDLAYGRRPQGSYSLPKWHQKSPAAQGDTTAIIMP